MKTDDLIRALAEDERTGGSPRRSLLAALLGSIVAVAVLFAATLGPRPNLPELLGSWRFDLKLVYVWALTALAVHGVMKLANPVEQPGRAFRHLAPALLLLVAGLVVELWLVPTGDYGRRLIGRNAVACLTAIPFFSLVPLGAFLYAMRDGAPASATWTGALIGLLSAGLGASFYALHCTDDSPLFVAFWYTIAIGVVTAAGALLGRRLLRW